MRTMICSSVVVTIASLLVTPANTFSPSTSSIPMSSSLFSTTAENTELPLASLAGYVPQDERPRLEQALVAAGFQLTNDPSPAKQQHYEYSFSKATGMLQLQASPPSTDDDKDDKNAAPRWIPLVKNMENILVANGWSFLDPDENDPLSAFDVDAANLEGQYQPKWGALDNDETPLSDLGFSLQPLSKDEILQIASQLSGDLTRQVLLEGATDPPNVKQTHNGFDFSGSVSNIPNGAFVCAIGNLPLFTTRELSPAATASSGWLSFREPVSNDHVRVIHAEADAQDQRIEVVCAKTGCHLGHYFGRGNGYCINAAALNFVPAEGTADAGAANTIETPTSWTALEEESAFLHGILKPLTATKTLLLGAGCFWHVEYALRRLPGVVSTQVGYAGGNQQNPTYEEVCGGNTGHAEVVRVDFDPKVLEPHVLADCFLAMHDPTKVRAHGKHEQGIGQYRSCIFGFEDDVLAVAKTSVDDCKMQLNKEFSTEIRRTESFWPAEERHQRHDERRRPQSDASSLSVTEWLQLYGRRQETVWGSSETIA